MAPKKLHIFPLFPLFILSLLRHIIIARGDATSLQEYETWLLWNVQNHHLRRLTLANPQPNDAGASGAPTKTLDVRLENAEINKVRWTINLNGTGDYKTITEAIDSVPIRNTRRLILHIMPGVYREKIHIPKTKPFITFMGDPDNPPIITGNDSASATRGDGTPLSTFQSATVAVDADYFIAYNIIFENCTLNSVAKKVASLTAQKRSKTSMSSGFSFKDCKVTGTGKVYLGRAWGDYSRVVYSFSFLDKLVNPLGWNNWGKSNRDSMVYYGEYKCIGPGSNITGRVSWARVLTDKEAEPFIGTYYVEGDTWLISPST
uniref:pectinesterase n=1 Tax=Chenopodium quinoa TaxID=63459 RepID=A0A803LEZ6_CHEQI